MSKSGRHQFVEHTTTSQVVRPADAVAIFCVTRSQNNQIGLFTDITINHLSRPWYTFGSVHEGGAHFFLGDGSGRFISENINQLLYQNFGKIADGAVIGEF